MRSLLAALVAGAALLAAGCGGSGGGSSLTANTIPDTASLAPAAAGLWVSLDTDRSSDQWTAVDAVLAQIPGGANVIDDALAKLTSKGKKLDFQLDVQPALGNEVVVVVPSGASDPVVLVKPTDDAKLQALLQDSSTPVVTGKTEDWTVVAQTQKALDAYQAALAKGTLADSDAFAAAMNGLPQVAIARVYVDGKGLGAVAKKAAGTASGALKNAPVPGLGTALGSGAATGSQALDQLGTMGFAVSAGDGVLHVDGSVATASGVHVVSFKPTLLERVPGDALAAITFSGDDATTKQVSAALAKAGSADALAAVEKTLGVSVGDLLGLADGQGVLYVRPGLLIPELTIVLEPQDPAQALQTLDTVVTKLAAKSGAKITQTTQAGVALKQLTVSVLTVAWGRDGDRIVITTGSHAIADLDGDGPKLAAAAGFKKAADDVDLGDETGGFAYVDVKGLAPLLNMLAGVAGSAAGGSASGSGSAASTKKLTDTLAAIDSIAFNASVDGTRVRFRGAVRVGG